MIDETTQTSSSAAATTEQAFREAEEKGQCDECIPAAESERYYRMKLAVLGLLSLVPFLLWLSGLIGETAVIQTPTAIPAQPETAADDTGTTTTTDSSTDTNTFNVQREDVQVNIYLDDLLITASATPDPTEPGIVQTRTVTVTEVVTETLVTVQPVTQTITLTEQIEITRVVVQPPPPPPGGEGEGCTRFDLEIGRNQVDGTPEDGIYIMQETSGHRLATWAAKRGWLDSGWLQKLPLSQDVVHVQVFFYPASGGGPIELEILNHAPNLPYGWVANDQCHAVEIQFPE